MSWAGLVDRVVVAYQAAADPANALAMKRYMRDQFEFYGIKTTQRRRIDRGMCLELGAPSEHELARVLRGSWERPCREVQYFGQDRLSDHIGDVGPSFLAPLESAITSRSWWDTVDALATKGVGRLVRAHPELLDTVAGWVDSDDIWLARSSLIFQLGFGSDTHAELLFELCARRAGDTEFFIRKAIGWALRQHARTDPEAVRRFVAEQGDRLSGLSRREALRHIG